MKVPARLWTLVCLALACGGVRGQESAWEDEVVQYRISGSAVYGAIIRDPSGKELRRETYVRDSDGELREILVEWAEGGRSRIGASGLLHWMKFKDGGEVFRTYYPDGSLRTEETREKGILLRRTTFFYTEGSDVLQSILRETPAENARELREFDSRGLVVREVRTCTDGGEETLLYSYDGDSRIVEVRRATGRKEFRTRFLYGEDGSETEERFDETGALCLRILKNSDGVAVEEQYDGGILFARTYWKDGRKLREEITAEDGQVRVREEP